METIVEKIVQEAVSRAVTDIRRNLSATGTNATGKTSRSLEWRVRSEGNRIIGEVLGRKFFGAVETGSRPASKRGTDKERQAFEESLKEWCMVRGFPSGGLTDEQYTRVAKWLRWYITKHGTRLWRNGGRKDIITPVVEWCKKYVTERITASIDINFFPGYPDRQ